MMSQKNNNDEPMAVRFFFFLLGGFSFWFGYPSHRRQPTRSLAGSPNNSRQRRTPVGPNESLVPYPDTPCMPYMITLTYTLVPSSKARSPERSVLARSDALCYERSLH